MIRTSMIAVLFLLSADVFPAKGKVLEFRLEGMSCEHCAKSAKEVLGKAAGIREVELDFESKKVRLVGDEDLTEEAVKRALKAETPFEALFPGDSLVKPLSPAERERVDIKEITGGKRLDLKAHLAPGKFTVFDFHADWCAPCRILSPKLERLLWQHDNLALRKVEVATWESEVARQMTEKYRMPGLPFLLVFDAEGKLLAKVDANHMETLAQVLKGNRK